MLRRYSQHGLEGLGKPLLFGKEGCPRELGSILILRDDVPQGNQVVREIAMVDLTRRGP